MSKPSAVLVFGSIHGKFKLAFRKLQVIKEGIGHVDFAICVGDFFSTKCDESWNKVRSKELNAPVQIYILGASSPQLERFYSGHEEMSDLADNITYLGKSGVFNTLEGLKIAYLSGTLSTQETQYNYTYDLVKRLLTSTSNDRLDILVTWSWPTGIGIIPASYKQLREDSGLIASYLFSKTSPQYHFGGCERIGCDLSIERQLSDGSSAGVSRFVGLGSIEENKLLWIKGINMTPYSLTQRQDNKSIVPLAEMQFKELSKKIYKEENINTINNIRFELKRPSRRSEEASTSKSKKARENECWFCLSSTRIDKHLIVSLGKHCYLALDKGPISDEHLLIIPIQHLSSMKNVTDNSIKHEINRFKQALIRFCRPNKKPIFFERSTRTLHLQINCIPVEGDKFTVLPNIFKGLVKKYGLNIREYFDNKFKFDLIEDKTENYFYVDLCDGHELFITGSDFSNLPLTFGREALTCKEVLNIPEKMIWQKCRMPKEDELKLVSSLKKKFKPFDFID